MRHGDYCIWVDVASLSLASASAVPSIRDLILAKAVSRAVEVSSANGEKPQSSQVPNCSSEMIFAASIMRFTDLFGRFHTRIKNIGYAKKDPLAGFDSAADSFENRMFVLLCGIFQVEVGCIQLEEIR